MDPKIGGLQIRGLSDTAYAGPELLNDAIYGEGFRVSKLAKAMAG